MTVCDTKETIIFAVPWRIISCSEKGGFVVEDLREPLPPKELIERHPNFRGEEKRSLILIMKCKRL